LQPESGINRITSGENVLKPRVLLVSAEAVPLTKTGGLADVVSALAASLREQQVDASILMPGYGPALDSAVGLRRVASLRNLPCGSGQLLQARMPDSDVPVLLLDTKRFRQRRGNPYLGRDGREHEDNALCYASLAHAAVRICAGTTTLPVPHVLHGHDWHAGLAPGLLKARGIRNVGSVFSIHNLAFQGNYPAESGSQLGLSASLLESGGMEFWGQLSFLKAGIHYADRISTVSHSYAREILTPEFGSGMDEILRRRRESLRPVANGVDTASWNPITDPLIASRFSADDLEGKAVCKRHLQSSFGLREDPNAFVLAVGSRMTHQKMADVVVQALPEILQALPNVQVAVIGCGESTYEEAFEKLAEAYPQRVGVQVGYDEKRAHWLHAGADALLHGSRFEPFGLTPIYSMLYGTLPVSSRVGGLRDTIVDEEQGTPGRSANGFLFDGDTVESMVAAVKRAQAVFETQPSRWQALQRSGMRGHFDWTRPAREYIAIYEEVASDSARGLFAATALDADEEPRPARKRQETHKGGLTPAYRIA
jgi:starch synthase